MKQRTILSHRIFISEVWEDFYLQSIIGGAWFDADSVSSLITVRQTIDVTPTIEGRPIYYVKFPTIGCEWNRTRSYCTPQYTMRVNRNPCRQLIYYMVSLGKLFGRQYCQKPCQYYRNVFCSLCKSGRIHFTMKAPIHWARNVEEEQTR